MKSFGFLKKGRKVFFTLALFILVFAAASVVKIHAAGNVTGWLWGGSEDANLGGVENCMIYPAAPGCIDGDETGLGWISMNCKDGEVALGKTCKDKNDPTFNPATNLVDYGVTFPSSGNASGYAWSESVGWIDFSGVTVSTVGNEKRLSGSAQIISIVQAGANAGGWSGSIKMSGNGASWDGSLCAVTNDYGNNNRCNYGVKIDSSGNFSGKAWNGEELGIGANMANGLGWIDFSRAKYVEPCTPLAGGCGSALSGTYCTGDPAPILNLCNSESVLQGPAPSGNAPWSWQCISTICPGPIKICGPVKYTDPDDGQCGTATKENFCGKDAPAANLCVKGTASSVSAGYSEYTWTCGSAACGGHQVSCSAPGNHCGWIETNP